LTIPRIYFPENVVKGERYKLGGQNLHYLKSVLRMRDGDRLFLFDGEGFESEALIRALTARDVTVEIVKKERVADKAVRITLFQGLPKANKMDFIVRKATELGVDTIVPFTSARTIPRISPEMAVLRTSRWQKIATEAARQCGSPSVPKIKEIHSFAELMERSEGEALKLIFWEEEAEMGLKQVLQDKGHVREFSIVIGPEGGFLKEEIAKAMTYGFISVGLGRQILKVETAALAILSIIQYERGIFGNA